MGEKYDEDLFYAGTLLMHRAMLLDEAMDDDMDEVEEDDLDEMLDLIQEEFGDVPEEPEAKIVPLFGEKKDKKK